MRIFKKLCPYEVLSELVCLDLSWFIMIFLKRILGFMLQVAFTQAGKEGTLTSQELRSCQGKVSLEQVSTCLEARNKAALGVIID